MLLAFAKAAVGIVGLVIVWASVEAAWRRYVGPRGGCGGHGGCGACGEQCTKTTPEQGRGAP